MFYVCTSNCWWKVQTTQWHFPHIQKTPFVIVHFIIINGTIVVPSAKIYYRHSYVACILHIHSHSIYVSQSNYVINKIKAMCCMRKWIKEQQFAAIENNWEATTILHLSISSICRALYGHRQRLHSNWSNKLHPMEIKFFTPFFHPKVKQD